MGGGRYWLDLHLSIMFSEQIGVNPNGSDLAVFSYPDVYVGFNMTDLTPIESEFATSEDAAAYDAWFRSKVERAMASTAPKIPHDQVMAEMRAIIERAKTK